MGVIVFNRVCGFSTKDPPRLGKVMKALTKLSEPERGLRPGRGEQLSGDEEWGVYIGEQRLYLHCEHLFNSSVHHIIVKPRLPVPVSVSAGTLGRAYTRRIYSFVGFSWC